MKMQRIEKATILKTMIDRALLFDELLVVESADDVLLDVVSAVGVDDRRVADDVVPNALFDDEFD